MSNQQRIQRPTQTKRRDETAAPELRERAEQLDAAEQSLDAIDRILAEDYPQATAEGAEVIGARPKTALRASSDEDFVRAFRQEVGE
jgi:hypothetical protein